MVSRGEGVEGMKTIIEKIRRGRWVKVSDEEFRDTMNELRREMEPSATLVRVGEKKKEKVSQ